MRGTVLAVVVIVAACSGSFSPTAQSSPSPTTTPSSAGLKGDLPVYTWISNAPRESHSVGGFLHFPGGAFRGDPRADMVKDATVPTLLRTRTPDQPYLYAFDSSTYDVPVTYDREVGRWLPVNRAQVSDDGLRYAYIDYEFGVANPRRIHIVDVRSGTDQVMYRDTNQPQYAVVGLAQQNIYLTEYGDSFGQLWRLDATTGSVTKVSGRRGRWVIIGRVAWMVTCWSILPNDLCFGGDQRKPNGLLRIDLATGNEETWSREAGIDLIGIDGDGVPLVMVISAGESVLLRVSTPDQTERIFSVPINALTGPAFGPGAFADRFGTWFFVVDPPPAAAEGIYLYARAFGARKISDFRGLPAGSFG